MPARGVSEEGFANGVPRVLLMGNPNVGKSAVFSRLTGARVIISNYPGTTVSFTEGTLRLDGRNYRVIDVPGVYTLEPESRAEQVAVDMLEHGDVVVNVVDATNLERNLNLTLQLLRRRVPMVVALNMWDEAVEHGVSIDVAKLSELLGVPVVPTCAISGEGMRDLQQSIKDARPGSIQFEDEQRWDIIGRIVAQVQTVRHKHPTVGQKLSHASVHPIVGPVLALAILAACFEVVRLIGEGIITHLADPFFNKLWLPVVQWLSAALGSGGLLHDLLIGRLPSPGAIGWAESMGMLTTGLYIELAQVLPYAFSFYLVLGVLEDTGYLPRLGVLVDNVMHRVGLHGLSVVPMMLGLGCNVPGVLALRVLETRKERFIAATLLAVCVPCVAKLAMISVLLGPYGAAAFLPVFGTLFVLWVVLGTLLKRLVRGSTPEILVDIPPYRLPYWGGLLKKLWMRLTSFLVEAVPFVLLGVLLMNLLHVLGAMQFLSQLLAPLMSRLFGLPPEAVGALVVGFLRKDVAVGMLAPLGLSLRQLVVACVVLSTYFPCAATFAMLLKELGGRDMAKAAAIMVVSAFATGALLNLVLRGMGL